MAGLDEATAGKVTDGYEASFDAREVAALELTDCLIGMPGEVDPQLAERLRMHFTEEELTELMLGVGLFLGMSKVLILLGLEPESMPVTVIPTPGS